MPAGEYLEGFLFFLPTLGFCLGASWLVLNRRFPQLRGASKVVALGLLAVLAVLAAHIVPAALSILSRPSVLVAAAILLAVAFLVPAVDRQPDETVSPADAPRAAEVITGIAAGVLALFALAITRDQLFLAPLAVDTLNFHLPGVAAWIQHGSIWQIDAFLNDVAPGHYPQNGDVLLLAAVLPWSSDFLSHFAMYPVYVLTGVTGYALALELRVSRAVAVAAATLLLAMPAVIVPALTGSYTDALMLFGFGAGILFLVRHARSGLTSELVLAGLGLGVAFGTKWYGVSAVVIVFGVWLVARLAAGAGVRRVARQAAAVIGLIALAGGIWMLRNWVESGNPLFPVRLAPFGIEVFDAPVDVVRSLAGYTIAGYVDDPSVWADYILPQYRDVLAFGGLVLIAGLVATVATVLLRRGRAQGRGLVIAGLAAAGLILATYSITPYSAGGPEGMPTLAGSDARYAIPALLIGVPLIAWTAARFRHGATVLASLTLAAVADGVIQVSDSSLSAATIGINDWAAAIILVALLAFAAWLAPRAWAALGDGRRRPIALAGVAVLAIVAICAAGYEMQKKFSGVRYFGQDPTTDFVLRESATQTVGLAGNWDDGISPVLPAFGPRLRNEVAYVGEEDDGFLRRYESQEEFAQALEEGGFDLVFVGHGIPRQERLPEEAWALAAGWEVVARSDRLTLLRAPGAG